MSSALQMDHLIESKSSIKSDEYVSAKDLKIAFFEFKEEINPKLNELDKKFSGLNIKLNIIIMGVLPIMLGSFGYIFKMLWEISARLPK